MFRNAHSNFRRIHASVLKIYWVNLFEVYNFKAVFKMTSCLKKSLSVLQTFSRSAQMRRIAQSRATKNLAVPQPDGQPKTFSPKIEEIANSIAQLNLVEVAELSDLLKKKLNLPDAAPISFAGVAAPIAPKEEEEAQNVQTLFTVKIKKFDEKQKVALIKEIKNILEGMNLVQAKKFVESAPVVVRQDIGKDEAEKLKEALVKVGADVEIS